MTSWQDVTAAEPQFADHVRRTFAVRKHATMATISHDGTPRISGTEIDFSPDGEVYLEMMPGTRRADDLRRDPRVAIHCPTDDAPEDATKWLGDGKITAAVSEIQPNRFRLDIRQVVLTNIAGDRLQVTSWSPGRELVRFFRD